MAVSRPTAAQESPDHGLTSITILTRGTEGSKTAGSKYEEVVPPRPLGALETPMYPDQPLKAKFGEVVVGVRVFLDATGKVIDIIDAPTCPSTGGRFAAEFRSAVEQAIHQWKFQPAEYCEYVDGKDLNGDGTPDYKVVIATKPVPVHFDVRFDFSIVKGHGQVK